MIFMAGLTIGIKDFSKLLFGNNVKTEYRSVAQLDND